MADKNYLGNGWENTEYNLVNLSINKAKINELPEDDYGNVKITVAKMKKQSEKSKATHTVYENTYKKENKESNTYSGPEQNQDDSEDLPFSGTPQ